MFSEMIPNVFGLILDILLLLLLIFVFIIAIFVVFVFPITKPKDEKKAVDRYRYISSAFEGTISVIRCYATGDDSSLNKGQVAYIIINKKQIELLLPDKKTLEGNGGYISFEGFEGFCLEPIPSFPVSPVSKLDYKKNSDKIKKFSFIARDVKEKRTFLSFKFDEHSDYDVAFNNIAFSDPNFFEALEERVPYLSYNDFQKVLASGEEV